MKFLFLLILPLAAVAAEPPVVFRADFENEAIVGQEWTREGADAEVAVLSNNKAASGRQSLALEIQDAPKSAAWLSKPVDIPQAVLERGFLSISWRQLHSIASGHAMRFSIVFVGGGMDRSSKHFTARGESAYWSGGQFSEERHEVPIPSGATQVKFKLSSAVTRGASGVFYLDDLVVE